MTRTARFGATALLLTAAGWLAMSNYDDQAVALAGNASSTEAWRWMPEYDQLSKAGAPLGPPNRDAAVPGQYTREYERATADVRCAMTRGEHSTCSISYKTDDVATEGTSDEHHRMPSIKREQRPVPGVPTADTDWIRWVTVAVWPDNDLPAWLLEDRSHEMLLRELAPDVIDVSANINMFSIFASSGIVLRDTLLTRKYRPSVGERTGGRPCGVHAE